jgi:hypothetical protein
MQRDTGTGVIGASNAAQKPGFHARSGITLRCFAIGKCGNELETGSLFLVLIGVRNSLMNRQTLWRAIYQRMADR